MIWTKTKEAVMRAGLEPWLRPIFDRLRRREAAADDVAARELIARLAPDAICVDIGCHKGIFLDPMRKAAHHGRFFAFEPIPHLCELLRAKYRGDGRVEIFNVALSSANGTATFYINEREMGLSGLSSRSGRAGIDPGKMRQVEVTVTTLDEVLGLQHVDFIKIDVEGAEYDALQGARGIIARSRPVILFEFGLGGAEYFGVDAGKMFDFFASLGYSLYSVTGCVRAAAALDAATFGESFTSNSDYNFVALPYGARAGGSEFSPHAAEVF